MLLQQLADTACPSSRGTAQVLTCKHVWWMAWLYDIVIRTWPCKQHASIGSFSHAQLCHASKGELQDHSMLTGLLMQVSSTMYNESSSRSHTIIRLRIESSSQAGAAGPATRSLSYLNIIDLAGSESAKVSCLSHVHSVQLLPGSCMVSMAALHIWPLSHSIEPAATVPQAGAGLASNCPS